MKYLNIINSFDEFATDAHDGALYYHVNKNVYYWLNLNTIWGYIGYNRTNHKFVYNGTPYSIIPTVPDPENLTSPVIVDSGSVSGTDTVLFKDSGFDIMPIQVLYPGPKIVMECNNQRDITSIVVSNSNSAKVEFLDADLSNLSIIASSNPTHQPAYIVTLELWLNESNGNLDADKLCQMPIFHKLWLHFNREYEVAKPEIAFDNVDNNISALYEWAASGNTYANDSWIVLYVDGCDKLEVAPYNVESVGTFTYYTFKNFAENPKLTIDGSNTNGVINLGYYFYRRAFGFTSSAVKYFSNIIYKNVTDYGYFYKPYMKTTSPLPFDSELLEYCKNKYLCLYYENTATVPSEVDWSVVSNTSYNLLDVKHFDYYPFYIKRDNIKNADSYITSYSQLVTNGAAKYYDPYYGVVSTPKLSNVNLETFAIQHDSNCCTYFNTDDPAIYIDSIVCRAGETGFRFYMGAADVHIKRFKKLTIGNYEQLEPTNSAGVLYPLCNDTTLTKGTIYIDACPERTQTITISTNIANESTSRLRIKIADSVGVENPTADDYYNGTVRMGEMWYTTSWLIGCSDIIIASGGNSTKPYNNTFFNKVKCVYGGLNIASIRNVTQQMMDNFVNAIPNVNLSGTFTLNQSQYDLLSQAQKDYIIGLGYTIAIIV